MPSCRPAQELAKGKRSSSLGAVKHAILCRSVVLRNGDESEEELAELLKQFVVAYQLRDIIEHTLVQEMVAILWRKARLSRAETAEIADRTEAWIRQRLMQPLNTTFRELALLNPAPAFSESKTTCNT